MSDTPKLAVVHTSTLRDVPAKLRDLADAIERGDHGEVKGCAFVLEAEKVRAFYWGQGEAGPNGFLLLHTGAHIVMNAVTEECT